MCNGTPDPDFCPGPVAEVEVLRPRLTPRLLWLLEE